MAFSKFGIRMSSRFDHYLSCTKLEDASTIVCSPLDIAHTGHFFAKPIPYLAPGAIWAIALSSLAMASGLTLLLHMM